MRLICPSCQKPVTVPDADAGKSTMCPECGHNFPAPELYSMAPVEMPSHLPPPPPPALPAPPPPELPRPRNEPLPAPATSPPGLPASSPEAPPPMSESRADLSTPEGARVRWLTISLRGIQWLPLVCLTLIFLLTFFKWIGMYPAGYKAYAQNAWQALFASFSTDPVSNRVYQLEGPLNEKIRASMWMLPYLVFLMAAVALTWAGHVFQRMNVQPPPWMQGVWQHRTRLLIGLVATTMLVLLLQAAIGFGLENAAYRGAQDAAAAESAEARRGAPTDKTPEEEQIDALRVARIYGGYHMDATFWLNIVVFLHLLALAGVLLENWLVRRGKRPEPRIGLLY